LTSLTPSESGSEWRSLSARVSQYDAHLEPVPEPAATHEAGNDFEVLHRRRALLATRERTLSDRVEELDKREAELDEREAQLAQRAAELDVAIEIEQEALSTREQELQELATRLARQGGSGWRIRRPRAEEAHRVHRRGDGTWSILALRPTFPISLTRRRHAAY